MGTSQISKNLRTTLRISRLEPAGDPTTWATNVAGTVLARTESPALGEQVLVLGMLKRVVRCSVCGKVHDLTELVDLRQVGNGTFTFVCPAKQTGGSYQIEQVGTLNT